jgi:hypothetical protein
MGGGKPCATVGVRRSHQISVQRPNTQHAAERTAETLLLVSRVTKRGNTVKLRETPKALVHQLRVETRRRAGVMT